MSHDKTTARPQATIPVPQGARPPENMSCVLIGELFETPSKQRFNPGGSVRGEGKIPSRISTTMPAALKPGHRTLA